VNDPRTLHRLAITVYLALIALLLLWMLRLDPLPASVISPALLVLLGPLLLPLRGIIHGRRYTMAWSTMLIMLYFIHGIAAASSGGRAALLGGAEVALVLSYFGLAIRYVRLSNPARPAGPNDGKASSGE
jgi:uncharacterized membrane protein